MNPLNILGTALALTLMSLTPPTSAEPVPVGTFYLKAQHSGKCVHQHGGTFEEGGKVTQWECIDQPNVRIEKLPVGGPYFMLRFQHSGKCLTVKGEGRSNGTPIIQQTCHYDGPIGQTWEQVAGEGKYIKLQSQTGLCLHQHGQTTSNGDPITGWECVDQPNVRWELIPQGAL